VVIKDHQKLIMSEAPGTEENSSNYVFNITVNLF